MFVWFKRQWSIEPDAAASPPDLERGFQIFIRGNNLSWLPNTTLVDSFAPLHRKPKAQESEDEEKKTDKPSRNRARNRHRDSRFFGQGALATLLRPLKVGELIKKGGKPPPGLGGDKKERCLSWHIKGECYDDCERKADHVKLEGEEKKQLHQWCVSALE